VQDAERQIHDIQVAIAEKKSSIKDVQSKLIKNYRSEELKNKELELFKAEQELILIQISLEQNKIYSSNKGKITEILVNEGEVVAEDQPLITAEYWSPKDELVFYAYFPSETAKYIHVGSTLKMYPSTVNHKEYGALLSRVENVSAYPISEQAIVNRTHNANLTRFLTNQIPVTQVIAIPIKDPQDPSGYLWTSHLGPSMVLSTGIIGKTEVEIESIHPIYYLFPNKEWKKTSIKTALP
jgi:multidrug resistance efflux pump